MLRAQFGIERLKQISPVLPVLSHQDMRVPFITCEEMLRYNAGLDLELWELALRYESARGHLSEGQVFERMAEIVQIMHASIRKGHRRHAVTPIASSAINPAATAPGWTRAGCSTAGCSTGSSST